MYNVPVRQSRHKELNVYISNALADSRAWMEEGMVESVVVSIEDATSGKQLERSGTINLPHHACLETHFLDHFTLPS
jgi:hypothetical protein